MLPFAQIVYYKRKQDSGIKTGICMYTESKGKLKKNIVLADDGTCVKVGVTTLINTREINDLDTLKIQGDFFEEDAQDVLAKEIRRRVFCLENYPEKKLHKVNIDLIIERPTWRKTSKTQHILLVESIKELGIVNPINVTNTLLLVNGFMRYRAAKEAGLKKIPAFVVGFDSIESVELMQLEYNQMYEI